MRRGGALGRAGGSSPSISENSAQSGTPTYRSTARWNEMSTDVFFHAMTHSGGLAGAPG